MFGILHITMLLGPSNWYKLEGQKVHTTRFPNRWVVVVEFWKIPPFWGETK